MYDASFQSLRSKPRFDANDGSDGAAGAAAVFAAVVSAPPSAADGGPPDAELGAAVEDLLAALCCSTAAAILSMSLPDPPEDVELDELHPPQAAAMNMNATADHCRFM
jgi:hypothetical protein